MSVPLIFSRIGWSSPTRLRIARYTSRSSRIRLSRLPPYSSVRKGRGLVPNNGSRTDDADTVGWSATADSTIWRPPWLSCATSRLPPLVRQLYPVTQSGLLVVGVDAGLSLGRLALQGNI